MAVLRSCGQRQEQTCKSSSTYVTHRIPVTEDVSSAPALTDLQNPCSSNTSVQGDVYALPKAHMRSTLSLKSSPLSLKRFQRWSDMTRDRSQCPSSLSDKAGLAFRCSLCPKQPKSLTKTGHFFRLSFGLNNTVSAHTAWEQSVSHTRTVLVYECLRSTHWDGLCDMWKTVE